MSSRSPETSGGKPDAGAPGQVWKWIALAALLVAICVAWFLLPVNDWLKAFNQWLLGLGPLGVILFAVVYIVATVVLAPAAPLSIAAGVAYGGWGMPIVLVSATIGAALAFLVARYLLREKVRGMVESRPTFKAVDKAVAEDGWKIVGLLRLSPLVPFNLQNYFFGVTQVSFLHYVAATFIGIVPGVILYVYLGVIGQAAGSGAAGGPWKWVLFGLGLAATVAVAVLVTRKAQAKLREVGVGAEGG